MMLKSIAFFAKQKAPQLLLAIVIALSAVGVCPPDPVRAARGQPVVSKAEGGLILNVDDYSDDVNHSACGSAAYDCSLRGAIQRANTASGAVTINLPEGSFNLFGRASDDDDDEANQAGDLDITKVGSSISLIGAGADKTTLNGNHNDRILDVADTYTATTHLYLKDLSLTNGGTAFTVNGGAIRSYGSVDLDKVIISNSIAQNGGAIYIQSRYTETLTVNRSIFTNNNASLDGGAIYNVSELASINNSTFDHNNASGKAGLPFGNEGSGRGAAILNKTNLVVNNSTFFVNNAKNDAGAIMNYAFEGMHANTTINNSTFNLNGNAVSNYTNGNGLGSTTAVTTISNSVLANSTLSENCVNRIEDKEKGVATIVNGGHNLDSGVGCGFGSNGDSLSGEDARLGNLEENGGLTPTVALLEGSPAINGGNPGSCIARDQRGLSRESTCDMGAYEYGAAPRLTPLLGSRGSLPDGSSGVALQVLITNQIGNPLEGWLVNYEIPDGANIPVSGMDVRSNSQGLAWIYAGYTSVGLGSSYTITAKTSGGYVWFLVSRYGIVPRGHSTGSSLPVTGFTPGRVSELPRQAASQKYREEGQLELEIPQLGLKLPIVGIPKTNDGWDTTWLNRESGYLEGTAFPSWKGNSVLTGHVTLADGTAGPFAKLGSLKWGDQIIVEAYGSRFVYEVRMIKTVSADDVSVLRHQDMPWVTLITCKDYDEASQTYLKRLAVSAVLIQSGTP